MSRFGWAASGSGPWSRPSFRMLWGATATSGLGTAAGAGVISLVAILVLDVSASQVTVMIALGGLVAAILSLPAGPVVELRRKRPVMVGADLARAAAVGSVPVLIWIDRLSFWHLCAVVVVVTALSIAFAAASVAHLKDLLPAGEWGRANAAFESINWTLTALITPLGGVLTTLFGPTVALTVNALCFLGSAMLLRRIKQPEPPPPARDGEGRQWVADATAGWRYVHRVAALRSLFWNAMVFGGCITLAAPLLAIFMLRDLNLAPWGYALVLGVPAVGGVIGAVISTRLVRRFGVRRVLLTAGVSRTVWMLLIPLSPPGLPGLAVVLVSELMLMLSAGVFNPVFATCRMRLIDRAYMARVGAAWPVTAKAIQPLFILAGGLLAELVGVRGAVAVAAVVLVASSLLLPWRDSLPAEPGGHPPETHTRTHGTNDDHERIDPIPA